MLALYSLLWRRVKMFFRFRSRVAVSFTRPTMWLVFFG